MRARTDKVLAITKLRELLENFVPWHEVYALVYLISIEFWKHMRTNFHSAM